MGSLGVKSTSRGERVRAALGVPVARLQALSGAPMAWLLLLVGWVLVTAGAWLSAGPGCALLVAGVMLILFAATLVDVDRGGR
jgi:hypothetical protein